LGDRNFGELRSAQTQARKALARGIKEELSRRVPELVELNAAEGKLLDLLPVLERAVDRAGNTKGSWLRDSAVAGAAKLLTSSSAVGLGAAVLRNVLAELGVQSELAIRI